MKNQNGPILMQVLDLFDEVKSLAYTFCIVRCDIMYFLVLF